MMITSLSPRFKLWLSSSQGAFGDGKWRLLQTIEREGSLVGASRVLGTSYRKIWGDIKKAEECLGVTLVEKYRGGTGGGQTRLTPIGKKWIRAYKHFRNQIEKAMTRGYERHIDALVEK